METGASLQPRNAKDTVKIFQKAAAWHGGSNILSMENQKHHTIEFLYDVHDHSLKFPLKADVQCTAPGVYLVTNIQLNNQDKGNSALLPPMQLTKKEGRWIFLGNHNQESNLSRIIGQTVEERGIQYL